MPGQQGTGPGQAGQDDLGQGAGSADGPVQEKQDQGQPDGRLQDGELLDGEGGQVAAIGKGQRRDGAGKTGRGQPGPSAPGQVPDKEIGEQAGQGKMEDDLGREQARVKGKPSRARTRLGTRLRG